MMPITLLRTDATHPDFRMLIQQLDSYLAEMDGSEHAFYNTYNQTGQIRHVILAYRDQQPVGCGAFKAYEAQDAEIKRMFTLPEYRNNGIANRVLSALEQWAAESGFTHCILETGIRQQEAISVYRRNGYGLIPNYGPYRQVTNSVCFRKKISNP